MEKEYNAEIQFSTGKELKAKDKIKIKTFSGAKVLNDCFPDDGTMTIKPDRISLVSVHNERAKDDKDYDVLVIEADTETYRSSSTSLVESVNDIINALEEDGESITDNEIKFFKIKSKNNTGYILQATLA